MMLTEGRDALLASYGIDGFVDEPRLDEIAELAAGACGVPYAAVNLIGDEQMRQVAAFGMSPRSCARADSLCTTVLAAGETVVVPDATLDPRFADNPFVRGPDAPIRFYASSRLVTSGGAALGALCVFDDVPRRLGDDERRRLDLLATQAAAVLEKHRSGQRLIETVHELTEARAELLRSNTELAAFAGQVSHDLRNPLAALMGFLELLADDAGAEAANYVARAEGAATRMARLVESLLEYARVGGSLHRERLDLAGLLHSVVDDDTAPGPPIALDLGPLPPVLGDPLLIRVLLDNIVSNAVRFARPDRAPVLRVRARPTEGRWLVELADNGRGVPVHERTDAFTLLRQVHEPDASLGGAGIGLATCRRIVLAHGGSIGIDDGIDGGAAVWFTLPAG